MQNLCEHNEWRMQDRVQVQRSSTFAYGSASTVCYGMAL